MASSVENLFIEEEYIYKAKLPFPQRPSGILSEKKSGIRYRINFKGAKAICDLSPFPGLTNTTIEDVKTTWDQLFSKHLRSIENYLMAEDYRSLTLLKDKTQSLAPIEFALFQLWCQLSPHGLKKTENAAKNMQKKIKKNDVLSFSNWSNFELNFDEEVTQVTQVTLKIKCSREELPAFLEDLKVKQKNFPRELENLKLRIDGNTQWQASDLISLWEELEGLGLSHLVDYFEEPLQNFQEYKKLLQSDHLKHIPIAHEEFLDEYLDDYLEEYKEGYKEDYKDELTKKVKSTQTGENRPLRVLVIKPSQWSLTDLFALKSSIEATRIVLSSAFELPQGIDALKLLALDLAPQEVHGLGAKVPETDIFREN